MTYQVLARKWRPQVFEEVVGQPFVVQTLKNAIKYQKLGQAYLFCGPRGVGKTTVARILAKALNCKEEGESAPCNRCSSCKEITLGLSPDVQEIDGASNRGIEEIRNLRENVKYLPTLGKKRIFIIDEVHMLTIHAFNALLKTLEEPPRHVVFIFATTEPHKVPPTILSRCQRFDFKRIPPNDMAQHIRFMAQKEGIQIDDPSVELIVRRSEGSMRDAQSLLDQLMAFVGERLTYDVVAELLGEIESSLLSEACVAIAQKDPKNLFRAIKLAYEKGYDLMEFYKTIMEIFNDALFYASGAEISELGLPLWRQELIAQIYKAIPPETLSLILGLMLRYYELLRGTDEPRLLMEVVLLRLTMRAELIPLSAILDRLGGTKGVLGPGTSGIRTQGEEMPKTQDEETPNVVGTKGNWEDFMEFLKRKKPMMAMSLSNWEVNSFGGDEVTLIPPDHPVLKDYLNDPQRMRELTQFLKEYFGKEIKANVRERKTPGLKAKGPIEELLKRFEGEIVPNGTIPSN